MDFSKVATTKLPAAGQLPLPPRSPLRRPAVPRSAPGVHPALRWTFLAFVFSLTFELGSEKTIPFEPPTLLAGLLVLLAPLQPRFTFQPPPRAFWGYVSFLGVYVLSYLLHGLGHEDLFSYRLFHLVLLLCILLPAYQLMRNDLLAKEALLALVLSATAVSVFVLLDPSGTNLANKRATFLSQNPANLASIVSVAMVAVIGLVTLPKPAPRLLRYLAWPLFALMGLAVTATGTRSALLGLGLGLSAFAFRPGGYWSKLRSVGLFLLLIGVLLYLGVHSSIMADRFEKSLAAGDMAKREYLYPAAWDIFLEDPLLGYGPVQSDYELQLRVQLPNRVFMECHNLVLDILTGTGVLGAIPFFAGICLCFLAAWKARHGTHGVLPLGLLVTSLAASMGMPWLYSKTFWFVIAYALARGDALEGTRAR